MKKYLSVADVVILLDTSEGEDFNADNSDRDTDYRMTAK